MITALIPLFSGNAIKLALNPPVAASRWRILRNLTGVFVDANSQELVYEGDNAEYVDAAVDNDTLYFYKVFYWVNNAWDGSFPAQSVTPDLAFIDVSIDPLTLVRDRLDKGLNALVSAGKLSHPHGHFVVLTASPQTEDTYFPVVTVHLSSDHADDRGIGDLTSSFDDYDPNLTGWYSSINLEIVAWCINGDERIAVRKAIKSVLIANLEFFNLSGLYQLTLNFCDSEDFEGYHCPVFRSHTTLHGVAISGVRSTIDYPPATINSIVRNPYG